MGFGEPGIAWPLLRCVSIHVVSGSVPWVYPRCVWTALSFLPQCVRGVRVWLREPLTPLRPLSL